MSWLAVAGLAGAVLGSRDTSRSNATNIALADAANKANAREARLNRRFQVKQVKSARRYDRKQIKEARRYERDRVADEREYNLVQQIAAEKRGRKYARQDRDEYRDYMHPANVRARLEEAGINPLFGTDQSGGFMPTTGAAAPMGASEFSFAPSPSGVAQGATATHVAAQVRPGTLGRDLFNAAQSYFDYEAQKTQLDLQATEIEMQNRRLSNIIERANLMPSVPGVYQRGSQGVQANRRDGAIGVDALFPRHPSTLEPHADYPSLAELTASNGSQFNVMNPDLDLDGPVQWVQSGLIAAAELFPKAGRFFDHWGSRTNTTQPSPRRSVAYHHAQVRLRDHLAHPPGLRPVIRHSSQMRGLTAPPPVRTTRLGSPFRYDPVGPQRRDYR